MGPLNTGRLWELTLEHSPVGMTLLGLDGTILVVNRALCEMLGYRRADLEASSWERIAHPDELAEDLTRVREARDGQRTSDRRTRRLLRADGTSMWGDLSTALVVDDAGEPRHLICQVVDVTEQLADQAELRRAVDSVERHRSTAKAILDTVDVGLLLLDDRGRYETMNRRHHDFIALAYPDGHHGEAGQVGEVFQADGETRMESREMPTVRAVRGEDFDDYRIWVGGDPATRRALSVSARSVRREDGSFAGAALAYSDVTDLMRALRSREEFLASVSHELRTPLTAVLGHLELLTEEDLGPSARHRLAVVQRNAVRLQHLVSDLLESATRRDGVPIVPVTTDVARLVRDVVETAQAATPGRAALVELVVTVPDSATAVVDADRVQQVVDNLVSNALKYTDAGGTVTVELVAEEDRSLRLVVTDTGIGIPADDLDQVFTPFFRTRAAHDRVIPGLGLGLGIARDIVHAHGGTLQVASAPGRGSRFEVVLPRRPL